MISMAKMDWIEKDSNQLQDGLYVQQAGKKIFKTKQKYDYEIGSC